jgi:hypothetical protein
MRIRLVHYGSAACVTDELVGTLAHTVAFASLGGYDFAGCSEAETLFAAAFGFQLWHFSILL